MSATLNNNIKEFIRILNAKDSKQYIETFIENLGYVPSIYRLHFMQKIMENLEGQDEVFLEKLNENVTTLNEFVRFLSDIAGSWIDRTDTDYFAMNEAFEEFEF